MKFLSIIILILQILIVFPNCTCASSSVTNYFLCNSCHQGIEKAGKGHAFQCKKCHLPNFDGRELKSHEPIIRNPASPKWQMVVCAKCHKEEVENVKKSLHATMAGIINQTRYLWGAQSVSWPPTYSANGILKRLPDRKPDLKSPAGLVDDFLRRKCLRCHISVQGAKTDGLYRATGCSSCHSIYDNDGLYKGNDPAIDKSRKGYPRKHGLTADIPTTQCLHCHNSNHVGADYVGLFQSDFNPIYQEPIATGIKPTYGTAYIRLSPDVHFRSGIKCIDCHEKSEIMGDGSVPGTMSEAVKVSCTKCHRGFSSPGFAQTSEAHRIKQHKKLRCSVCHAKWSFQDYGLSVIFTSEPSYRKWRHLMYQGDPNIVPLFNRELNKRFPDIPTTPDFITGKLKQGMWLMAWRFRRWEYMPLGIDTRGRIAIFRPQYQYYISTVDTAGNVYLDSVAPQRGDGTGIGWAFNPYSPHTIAPAGRSCNSCHGNRVSAGFGIFASSDLDTLHTVPIKPADPRARLFTREEKKKLLMPLDTPRAHF
ncbi:MAG: hypothetical protein DRG59_06755 [Deltaproteobacteria bacterium]|nr:MAG: hypothetical protein DRG83_11765 [Deltaproteobacteria bacterium]RLB07179.1 MAG: hypothetical protein DRG59_06755 [Deltaproteobacteria bacterium]